MMPELVGSIDAILASLTEKMLDTHAEVTKEFRRARKMVYFEGEGHGSLSDGHSEPTTFHHIESGTEFRADDLMHMIKTDF